MNDAEWFAEHTAYQSTPEWAFRRGQVLHRDGYRCQARLPGCAGEAVQVHHLTYKHWRNEPLFDLVAVCQPCHEKITEADRAQRPHESRIPREPDFPDFTLTAREKVRATLANSLPLTLGDIWTRTGLDIRTIRLALHRDHMCVEVGKDAAGHPQYGLADIGVLADVGMDLPVSPDSEKGA